MNTNCLEGIACPSCKNEETLHLTTRGPSRAIGNSLSQSALDQRIADGTMPMEEYVALWSDDGTEDTVGDVELVDEGNAECPECGHIGTVKDFHISR